MSNQLRQMRKGMNNQQVRINIEDTKQISCLCGSINFLRAVHIRRVSALISPTGKEQDIQLDLLLCAACGNPAQPENVQVVEETTEPPLSS